MARQKILKEPTLKNWEDVDNALRELGEAEIRSSEIIGEMNRLINEVKEMAAEEQKPYQNRIRQITEDIKVFVEQNRSDLGGKKTKELNFGKAGWRQSTAVTVPKATEQAIIQTLRVAGMADCILIKESVNKDALRQYGPDVVSNMGAVWKQKDEFWCEANLEEIMAR